MAIVCKSSAEIEKMRQSGRIVRQVLDHVKAMVAPGVSTMDLERAAAIHSTHRERAAGGQEMGDDTCP